MVHAFHASLYYGIGRTVQVPPPMDIDYRVIRISFATPPPPVYVNIMLLQNSIHSTIANKVGFLRFIGPQIGMNANIHLCLWLFAIALCAFQSDQTRKLTI